MVYKHRYSGVRKRSGIHYVGVKEWLRYLSKRKHMKKCIEFPNKRRYATEKEAITAMLVIGKKNLKTYRCECCGGWHLAKDTNI